jgi:glucokinase
MTVGALRGVSEGLFMPIGTGVSGAMVIGGVLNSHRLGGEIGHLYVGTDRECACGSRGCLETIATGPSIAARYFEKSGNQVPGAAEVFSRANSGDQDAREVWASAIEAISVALTSYISLLAPSVVVIGGGVSKAGDGLIQPLRESLQNKLVWQKRPDLRIAELGDLATCIGASILAQRAYQKSITT